MNWDCRLSRLASKQLKRLPRDRQTQLAGAIVEMSANPTIGDVRPIKSGKFAGTLRKRVGRYRIIFSIDVDNYLIKIAAILYRTDTTYN